MRLGAVTAAGLGSRRRRHGSVRRPAAQPPERPHRARRQGGAARPVLRRLRARAVTPARSPANRALTAEPLAYKIVRPSTVTAVLVGPDGAQHPIESGVAHAPGTYSFTAGTFDHEGTWRWDVSATDDLGRTSTIERTFRFDATLQALAVPRAARGSVRVGFTLTRPAQVTLRIETASGIVLRALPAAALQPGARVDPVGRPPARRFARVRGLVRRASAGRERRRHLGPIRVLQVSTLESQRDVVRRRPRRCSRSSSSCSSRRCFPAASELTMVYGGALASGALAGRHRALPRRAFAHTSPS